MTEPIRYFEDLEDFEAGLRRGEGWRVAKWLIVLGSCAFGGPLLVSSLIASGVEALLAVGVSAILIVAILLVTAAPRIRGIFHPQRCPSCNVRLTRERMQRALAERACPRCGFVFPSRKPPEARTVQLDAAHLPRVLLAYEKEIQRDETTPVAPLDPTNPYAASAHVSPIVPHAPRPNVVWTALLLLWMVTLWPLITIFRPRDAFLRQLPPTDNPADPQWQAYVTSYVRSQRRAAWFFLPWTVVLPLVLFFQGPAAQGLEALRAGDTPGAIAQWTWGVCMAFVGGVIALFVAWTGASLLLPRYFRRWLQGDPAPAKAAIDEKTGYYGLRLRFSDVTSQQQLPKVRFRFRQANTSELVVRLVNVADAQALQKALPCEQANTWLVAEIDLRALVRQSEPNFFGDELHLTGDPSGQLEVDDFEIVPRK